MLFVREERVAKSCPTIDCLLDGIEDLWHVTKESYVDSILRKGLKPGRNSVYLSPVSPWVEGFNNVTREGCTDYLRVDPFLFYTSDAAD